MHFDIVAKSLCAKTSSFDNVTCEKFEFMAAISAGISVNWGRILFQRLLGMVENSKKQSQGYTVPINILLTTLVKADLGASVKLHPQKILTSKFVQTYIKKNQDIAPEGETSKHTEDTASNTEGGGSQGLPPVPKKRICPLVARRFKQKQKSESSDSESTIDLPLKEFAKRRRTQRQHTQMGWTGASIVSQPDPIPFVPAKAEQLPNEDNPIISTSESERMEFEQNEEGDDWLEGNPGYDAHMGNEDRKGKETLDVVDKPISVEEHCQTVLRSTWNNVSECLSIFDE
ncbi:hypothetical protein F511_05292 [Dorcoceras hygrometricum]|uniref:Uncharacterized protein n=1 Tax=Dorcoceras hygrometricum TaxID=472368 RepID=A0A2Z7ALS6_9LAMI|nr:hypothetical protein F511_05292 [Dorcoceras hygrometricum]